MARLPNQFGGAAPWPGQTGRAGQIPTTRAPSFYGGAGQAATASAPSFYGGMGRSGGQAGGGMPQQMGAPMGFAGGQRPRPLPRPIGGQAGGMGQNLLATGGRPAKDPRWREQGMDINTQMGLPPGWSVGSGPRGNAFGHHYPLYQFTGPGGQKFSGDKWNPEWAGGQGGGGGQPPMGGVHPWPVGPGLPIQPGRPQPIGGPGGGVRPLPGPVPVDGNPWWPPRPGPGPGGDPYPGGGPQWEPGGPPVEGPGRIGFGGNYKWYFNQPIGGPPDDRYTRRGGPGRIDTWEDWEAGPEYSNKPRPGYKLTIGPQGVGKRYKKTRNPFATPEGKGEPEPDEGGGDIWAGKRNDPNRMFSGADTQNAINAFAAQAFGTSPYGKELAPGQSAGPGLAGAMAPQIGRIGAAINTASTSIPMFDKLANQKWQLANEQMRAQTALGQAGMAGGLYDMIQQDRMNKIRDMFGLIGGLFR